MHVCMYVRIRNKRTEIQTKGFIQILSKTVLPASQQSFVLITVIAATDLKTPFSTLPNVPLPLPYTHMTS